LKRLGLWIILSVFAGALAVELHARWREEKADHRLVLAVDWPECRDLAAREDHADEELVASLKSSGAMAIVLSPLTLDDLAAHHRVTAVTRSLSNDPLDTDRLHFATRALSEQAYRELSRRGAQDLRLDAGDRELGLVRPHGSFASLKQVELGFDVELIQQIAARGLASIVRVNADPWMGFQAMEDSLKEDLGVPGISGLIFNSDDMPGGLDSVPLWRSWLRRHDIVQALFEFHASRAALQMAHVVPANTYRSHSIPSLELKDMTPDQEFLRWRRAATERSNRILLMHVAPGDSWPGFLKKIALLRDDLTSHGWVPGFPRARLYWRDLSALQRMVYPWLAFLIAVITPLIALQRGRAMSTPYDAFLRITLITLVGSVVMTAIAQNPETRLEITPFRGIKAAFLLSWVGSIFILYSWEEIRNVLSRYVRRWDVLLAGFVIAVIAYILIRSGNAPASWKPAAEQGIRDRLESWLLVRPRFKEFALGHPILLVGLYISQLSRTRRVALDGRPWMVVGMLGQVSIVNTFCHLHSPLALALFRTFNGVALGLVIGFVMTQSLSLLISGEKA